MKGTKSKRMNTERKEMLDSVTRRLGIKCKRKILDGTRGDTGQLFFPVSYFTLDQRTTLYGPILCVLALAIVRLMTTQHCVFKVRKGTCYHRSQVHTHSERGRES